MGDMFILRRNPFLWQWLVESHRRRRNFFRTASRDIEVIERNTKDDDRVRGVLRRCREYLRQVEDELSHAPGRRQKIRRALGAIVGEHNIAFDPFAIISHATDATDWRLALPLAVVWPAEESQVAPLLRACADLGLRVIPRGAGTGLTGGAVPLAEGCVMVNTERLNRIGGIRAEMLGAGRSAAVMDVEAGVITEDAMAAAEKQGLVFATDPTSAWASTIGGNLAENAGGKSAVLWGTAIDNVLSFRVIMPGGVSVDVARVEHPLRKILPEDEVRFRITRDDGAPARDIVLRGNDLRKKSLWKDITNKTLGGVPGLQKEGTDGVITSARFVLYRAYEKQSTACLEFFGHSMDEASQVILALSREIQNRGDEALLALEHFDEEYVRAIGYRVKATREERPKAVLLIDLVAREDGGMKTGRATLEAIVARLPRHRALLGARRGRGQALLGRPQALGRHRPPHQRLQVERGRRVAPRSTGQLRPLHRRLQPGRGALQPRTHPGRPRGLSWRRGSGGRGVVCRPSHPGLARGGPDPQRARPRQQELPARRSSPGRSRKPSVRAVLGAGPRWSTPSANGWRASARA